MTPVLDMKAWRRVLAVIAVLLSIGFSNSLAATTDVMTLDRATKERVVKRVASIMADKYVDPDLGRQMGNLLLSNQSDGAYGSYDSVTSFCAALTTDLRSVSNDKHLFVFYSPEEAREVAAREGLLPQEEIARIERDEQERGRRANFGFRRIEILEGNIGYLELLSFSGADAAVDTAIAAMAFLARADAIIIDLRSNGGGGGLIPLLSSYFFSAEEVQLNSVYYRETGATEHSWTLPSLPGERLPEIDLYILTSERTFSAAEDFAYALQQLGRAVLVGAPTKGGAHPVDVLIVEGAILTQVSIGKSVNPITKANWEGTGVLPDVPVDAERALPAAHRMAIENVLAGTTDDAVRAELTSLIEKLSTGAPHPRD